LNVLFLIPSLEAGGAERVVVRLAEFLHRQGNAVTIGYAKEDSAPYALPSGVAGFRFRQFGAKDIIDFCEDNSIEVLSDHYHWNIRHLEDMVSVARAGYKIVITEHNSFYYPLFNYQHGRDDSALKLFQRRPEIYRNFAAVTTLNQYTSTLMAAITPNVVWMPNPLSFDASRVSGHAGMRLLTVSGFHKPAKRMDLMLQFFARLRTKNPDVTLRIVGECDGHLVEERLAMAGLRRCDVELIGRTFDVAEHYLASDLFVMTSEIEGQPMVLLEAAMHGLPQIAFEIGGLEDQIIEGETGHLVPFGDIDLLVDRADRLLRDRDLRMSMGAAARRHVSANFLPETIGKRWQSLLEAIRAGDLSAHLYRPSQSNRDTALGPLVSEFSRWVNAVSGEAEIVHVSVVVPVYGTEVYLERCLQTLSQQALREIEIIVVDDCSPGNASEIVRAFAAKDRRVRLVRHEENRGLYQARSTGSRMARGSYIAHIDSDDYVHPHMLSTLFHAALTHDADIAECQGAEIELDGKRSPVTSLKPGVYNQEQVREFFSSGELRHVVWNKIYKRTFWDATPFHNEIERKITITEDLLRNAFLINSCNKYVFVGRSLYNYIRRESSVTRNTTMDSVLSKLEDILFVYERVFEAADYFNLSEPQRARFARRRADDIAWYIRRFYTLDWREEESNNFLSRLEERFGAFGSVSMLFLMDKMFLIERQQKSLEIALSEKEQKLSELESRRASELKVMGQWHRQMGQAARALRQEK